MSNKYEVTASRVIECIATLEIEADSAKEAIAIARKRFKDKTEDHYWDQSDFMSSIVSIVADTIDYDPTQPIDVRHAREDYSHE